MMSADIAQNCSLGPAGSCHCQRNSGEAPIRQRRRHISGKWKIEAPDATVLMRAFLDFASSGDKYPWGLQHYDWKKKRLTMSQ